MYSSKWRARFGDVICTVAEFLRGTDTVAKLPRLPHETRRLSWDHEDAIFPKFKLRNSRKLTPSQRRKKSTAGSHMPFNTWTSILNITSSSAMSVMLNKTFFGVDASWNLR